MRLPFFILIILFASNFELASNPEIILPVYVTIKPESPYRNDILIYTKLAFQKQKVRTISKEETLEMVEKESSRVMNNYYKSGGDFKDFEKIKTYLSLNKNTVASVLEIRLNVDSLGNFPDTIQWNCFHAPIDFLKPPKFDWNNYIVPKNMEGGAIAIIQNLVDSIVASKKLATEM